MARVGEISVELSIDTKELTQGMKEVGRKTQEAGKAISDVGDSAQKAFSEVSDEVKELGDNVKKSTQDSTKSFQSFGDMSSQSLLEVMKSADRVWIAMEDGTKAYIDYTGRLRGENDKWIKDTDGIAKAYKEAQAGSEQALEKVKKALIEVQTETKDTETQGETSGKKFGEAWKEAGENAKQVSEKMKGIGDSLSKSITLPIMALGGLAGVVASEYDSAFAHIKNSLGATKEEAEKLTGTASEIYKKGFGEGFEDVQRALIQTRQNIKGIDDEDLQKVTKNAMVLAKTFDADVNEVTRATNNLMKGFGITSDEAFDLMAKGAQNGLNFSNEMFDNLSEYSPLFADMGFSSEEYFQLLQKGSESGVYNLDYLNDVMKEFQIRVKDGSKGTSDAMDQMSSETQNVWKEFNKGKKTVKDVHNAVIKELKGMDDQTKANQIGVGLYGTKWEDLEADAMYSLDGIGEGLENVDGTMAEMVKTQEETFGARFQGMFRELKSSLQPLGEVLIKMGEDWIPVISKSVGALSKWFKDLSPTMRKTVVIAGGIAAAIGPILVIVGSLAGAFANISLAIGLAGGAGAFFGGILAVITGPIGVSVLALVGLGLTVANITKEMKKASIESNVFSDEVSDSTKEAVGGYLDLEKGATSTLNRLSWGQQKITDDMANELIGQYKKMNEAILNEMVKDHAAQLKETQDFFSQNSSLTEAEEAAAIEKMKENQTKEQESVKAGQAEIEKIIKESKEKHGIITEEAAAKIQTINENMKTTAVKVMSENELEQQVILQRMKDQKSVMNAEMAADTIKSSLATKTAIEEEANANFLRAEENAKIMLEQGVISEEQANKIIGDAKKVKDDTITAAEETHTKVVAEAKKQAGDHIRYVDTETGEIKTKWQIHKEDLKKTWDETIAAAKEKYKNMNTAIKAKVDEIKTAISTKYEEIKENIKGKIDDSITAVKTKYTEMKTAIEGKIDDIKTGVSTKFGEIKTRIEEKIGEAKTRVEEIVGEIKGFFTGMKLSLPSITIPKLPTLPKVKITGSFSLKPPSAPKISWNASGGFIDNAGLVGLNNGILQGAGEAGREVIIPLENRKGMLPFSNAVADVVASRLDRGSTGGVSVQVGSLIVREEADIEKIARELYRLQQQENRRRGAV